jgi:hypothetical protein
VVRPCLRNGISSFLCAAFLGANAIAAPVLSTSQSLYDGLPPGASFEVTLLLENPDPITIVAYDFSLHSSDGGIFWLDGQMFAAPVNRPNFTQSFPFLIGDTTDNFGAFNSTFSQGFGPGSAAMQTLVFRIDPATPAGDYTLTFAWNQPSLAGGPSLLDSHVNEYQMSSPLSVTVVVVPEPEIRALLGAGGCIVLAVFLMRGAELPVG